MAKRKQIGIERCPCGICRNYFLVGIGQFVQGSGFSKADAQKIADLLNRRVRRIHIHVRRGVAYLPDRVPKGIKLVLHDHD